MSTRMPIRRLLPVLGCAALAAAPARAQERFVLAGPEVAVYNPAGDVEVVPAAGGPAVVEARREGRDGGRPRIAAARVEGRSALVVQMPAESIHVPGYGGEAVFGVRGDGSFGHGEGGGGRTLRLSGRGGGLDARVHLRVLAPPGVRVEVFSGAGRVRILNPRGDVRVYAVLADVEATVAGGVLSVRTGGGGVRVSGTAADVDVQTVTGGIDLRQLGTPGVVAVRTGGGAVRVDGVRAEALRVESTVGTISLSGVSVPSVTATSGGGGIRVAGFRGVRTMQLRSTTDDVEIVAPRDASIDFDLRTTVGRIEVPASVRETERTRHRFTGRMGAGATRIDASSGSGDVRVRAP